MPPPSLFQSGNDPPQEYDESKPEIVREASGSRRVLYPPESPPVPNSDQESVRCGRSRLGEQEALSGFRRFASSFRSGFTWRARSMGREDDWPCPPCEYSFSVFNVRESDVRFSGPFPRPSARESGRRAERCFPRSWLGAGSVAERLSLASLGVRAGPARCDRRFGRHALPDDVVAAETYERCRGGRSSYASDTTFISSGSEPKQVESRRPQPAR